MYADFFCGNCFVNNFQFFNFILLILLDLLFCIFFLKTLDLVRVFILCDGYDIYIYILELDLDFDSDLDSCSD